MVIDNNPIRTKIATDVLCQMVGPSAVSFADAYQNRDQDYANQSPEEFAAMVAVRYADALIKELDIIY